MRLFNLSPDTKTAGMNSSAVGSSAITDVKYGLSSKWQSFPLGAQTFTFFDVDVMPAVPILSRPGSPAGLPMGSTQFLLGRASRLAQPKVQLTSLMLIDAPEVGLCRPTMDIQSGNAHPLQTNGNQRDEVGGV